MTTKLAIAAIGLGVVSFVLFVLAIRRLLTRQAEVVVTMLRRYDDRLGTFAQTLNDALTALPSSTSRAALDLGDDPEPMMRALELARDRTSADGAIALVTGGSGTPIVATVGLSEAETNHMARMGFPDYRGARAIEVAFSGELAAPDGLGPIRAGLVMSLLADDQPQSLLSVITREPGRRFSEAEVDALDELVQVAQPAITRALNLREHDVVPELDILTSLYDRQSFHAVLDRELVRARGASRPLTLLLVDVDRLTTLNARLGRLAADGVLLEVAKRLRGVVHRLDYTFRLGGGRFAVVRPGSELADARELFDELRGELAEHPIGDAGVVSVSGGVAELLPGEDGAAFASRADAALVQAKRVQRGSVVNASWDDGRSHVVERTAASPGERSIEG